MDNKSDLFDLKREKQELDNFLSTIAGTDEPIAAPPKESAPIRETVVPQEAAPLKETAVPKETAPVKEIKPVEQMPEPAAPKPRQLASVPKPEDAFVQPAYHEKPAPPVAEVKPVQPVEEAEIKPKIKSSFLPEMEEKKEEPLSKIVDIQEEKAPSGMAEEFKTAALAPEDKTMTVDFEDERKALEEALYAPPPAEKKAGKGKWIGLLVVLVVLLAGAFWLFSGSIVNTAKSLPGVGSLVKGFASVEKDVNLINVRQRLVENKKTGKSMRVIEGIASNVSSQAISNVKVTATLQDAEGKELISMESIAGNILIDERLENMDATAIKTALQAARGAQDKIPPQGQIPFMIVFTTEPPGVFKMSVTPIGFTKQ